MLWDEIRCFTKKASTWYLPAENYYFIPAIKDFSGFDFDDYWWNKS